MKFTHFMKEATTAYQTVDVMKVELQKAGYKELAEADSWKIEGGKNYYVVRNDSSIIAIRVPDEPIEKLKGFHIVCAHSDSPCFKIKEKPVMKAGSAYWKLNVERYGGMIEESWFDRPLSIAGRIVVKKKASKDQTLQDSLISIPVDFKKPVCIIPSLAIHMRRGQDTEKINAQLHLLPMLSALNTENDGKEKEGLRMPDFMQMLADVVNETDHKNLTGKKTILKEDILGMDLYTYVAQEPVLLGMDEVLICSPRLDDLACAYSGFSAILEKKPKHYINVLGVFDNEEVGSKTMQGADSDFLHSVLSRMTSCLAKDVQDKMPNQELEKLLAGSMMLSADNAHAMHPNYAEKADPTNQPVLGGGIVLKFHGGQKYTTSGFSGAYVKSLCQQNGLKVQTYHNRSDLAGGSTLGNLALSHTSMQAADIGIAQLSMHSACETAAVKDIEDMKRLLEAFYAQ